MTISFSPSLTQSRDQYTEQVHNIGQSSLKICTSVQPVQGNPYNELNVRKWKHVERTGLVEGRVRGDIGQVEGRAWGRRWSSSIEVSQSQCSQKSAGAKAGGQSDQ